MFLHLSGAVLARDLSPPLAELLGCENVWCDSRTEESSQRFVLWAGGILERRRAPPLHACCHHHERFVPSLGMRASAHPELELV